jgi:hypothetical protein
VACPIEEGSMCHSGGEIIDAQPVLLEFCDGLR